MAKLSDLSALLRDRSRWPAYFNWDYRRTDSCAIGLAKAVGMSSAYNLSAMRGAFPELKSWSDAMNIFLNLPGRMVDILPEDVAEAIDNYLNRSAALTATTEL